MDFWLGYYVFQERKLARRRWIFFCGFACWECMFALGNYTSTTHHNLRQMLEMCIFCFFYRIKNEFLFFSFKNVPPFIPLIPTKSVSQKLHFAFFLSFSLPDQRLHPENLQNTLGLPEKAPSP